MQVIQEVALYLSCSGGACDPCHAFEVMQAFRELACKYHVELDIHFEDEFNGGKCLAGITIEINGELISRVCKHDVKDIFHAKIVRGVCEEN